MNAISLAPLIHERDRWQAMADQADCLLWISDVDGVFTGFNAAWLKWRGRQEFQEVASGWLDGLHPDDQQFWMTTFTTHLHRREPFTAQIRLRRADGAYGLVTTSARPWFEADGQFAGFVGTGQIDSAQPAPDPDQDGDLYRATIDALQEGVVVTDANGRYLTVNDAAAQLLGSTKQDLIRSDLRSTGRLDVVDENGAPVPYHRRPPVVARRTRHPVSGRLLGWHVPDQGLRWFSVNSRPLLSPEGSVTAVVTSFLDVTVQKHAADNARHEARHDALTGLVNRWGLRDVVRLVLERTPRQGEQVALLYCDLDNFKEVNDTFGHAAGDALLREVARRIKACVRSADIVARIGGDEVVAVLDGVNGLAGAMTAAEKVRSGVARPVPTVAPSFVPHLSIGVAILPSFEDFDETLNRADEAMYAAKAAGRNRVLTLDA
jgi:diguanylate cyclase (GGDEF)-like protein/PAS domain S-box-containing protein